jgi:hypothetical protein
VPREKRQGWPDGAWDQRAARGTTTSEDLPGSISGSCEPEPHGRGCGVAVPFRAFYNGVNSGPAAMPAFLFFWNRCSGPPDRGRSAFDSPNPAFQAPVACSRNV